MYRASNGKVYAKKESQLGYFFRQVQMAVGLRESPEAYAARKNREHTEQQARRDEIRRKKDDLIRVKQGYEPGEGYIASDGNVYKRKETREEYHRRKIASLDKQIEKVRRRR